MKRWHLLVSVLAIVGFSLVSKQASAEPEAVCPTWKQVNENAFGLGTGPDGTYTSEEGFEVLVFDDQLYVGMEGDNTLGARLWRTKAGVIQANSQADWEEVAADANGYPFGVSDTTQNDHIDSLLEFQGELYASTSNRSGAPSGTHLYRSPTGDPGSWEDLLTGYGPGFGDSNNENFKDLQIFQGQICGGTGNLTTGAEVWCSPDGAQWTQKSPDGFGKASNITIWSGEVYNDGLYFGLQDSGGTLSDSSDDVARLFRTQSLDGEPTWTEVLSGPPGSYRVDILGSLNGYLYASMRSSEGIVILRSPGGDAGSWVQVNQAGMNGDFNNFETVVDGATLYNQALYVGVANLSSGFQVWRTGGNLQGNGPLVRWEQVGGSGLGDPNNIYTELIPFNGSLYAWTSNYVEGQQVLLASCPQAKYVVLMIGDGQGANHQQAANLYTHSTPEYQTWQENWVSTFPEGGSYDPNQAWTDFSYVLSGYTDSAAAATALFSGQKTAYGHINVSSDKLQRLFTIADKARSLGRGVGAVSTVEISNATPGAWLAHNDSRENGYAIADESLWGDPNTTGDLSDSPYYGGGHGPSLPPPDVVLGSGHPNWESGQYVNQAMRDKLAAESGQPGAFTFIERQEGSPDGGERLLDAAANSGVTRLAGLFGGSDGNLEFRLADGSGQNPENPTLAQMTLAALQVLARNPQGFVLMVEGGAIDRASHGNHMDEMLGEQIGFNEAVQTVIDWVESPNNGSSWDNTLVIVTADHETGYLTAAPGAFPNQPLGEISPQTLALEKRVADSPRRASWDDENQNGQIDAGESVYWAWNTGGHSNSLVPLFAKGVGAELFAGFATGSDPVRGAYLDNTHVFDVMDCVVGDVAPPPINPPIWVYLPVVTNP